MGHWNYRVVRREYEISPGDIEVSYEIHEAHYDIITDTKPSLISIDPVGVHAGSLEGLDLVLSRMKEALRKPVLDYDTREELDEKLE